MTIAVTVNVPGGVECVVTEVWPDDIEVGRCTEHTVGGGCQQTFHAWGDKQLLIREILTPVPKMQEAA
jgi:hypothetical protein